MIGRKLTGDSPEFDVSAYNATLCHMQQNNHLYILLLQKEIRWSVKL